MKKILLTLTLLLCTVKLNAQVSIDWQKCLGGSGGDEFEYDRDEYSYSSMLQTSDGGYILSSLTSSNDGDVSGNHGGNDAWIVKFDAIGTLQWQKCWGGSGFEVITSILETSDGGYILSGDTYSNDGDVFGNHGDQDIWVLKLNATGTIQWQKCLGGSGYEDISSILQTSDGGYIISGVTSSTDGDASGNHGSGDAWILKINAIGNILWQKCLGGSGYDFIYSMLQTSDGGYIISGFTNSTDGDASGNHGGEDIWVLKLNATGAIQWQKCLGGSQNERLRSIQQTADGGYILSSTTTSNDGDASGNHGADDAWVVKINAIGSILWQKCFGGSGYDYICSMLQTSDGGYIISGYTESTDGDASGNHGVGDAWIVKLNASGTILWQKCLGGSAEDVLMSILTTSDGGYILSGLTLSNDGDVSGNNGNDDIWIVKLNITGTIQWQKCLGGTQRDKINSILPTSDGGYLLSGSTYSNDGDVSGNHGGTDIWIVKLAGGTNNLQSIENVKNSFAIYPNPANNNITIDYDGHIQKVEILDLKGAIVYSSIEPKNEFNLPQNIQSGYYTVVIQTAEGVVRKELMIQK